MRTSLVEEQVDGIAIRTDAGARRSGVLVGFTDRIGGVSAPPFDTLNLSGSVGDEEPQVLENRRRVAAAARFDADSLALARQVHGADVAVVGPGARGNQGEADVLVTDQRRVILGILTADCAPVAILGETRVAMIHAGWRGLVAGAIERGVSEVGTPRAAWVGPSIRACCYEVGDEVIHAFRERDLPVADDAHVDPARAAVVALRRAGVPSVAASIECTSCDGRFFSYRRDGVTGRQAGFVALLPA